MAHTHCMGLAQGQGPGNYGIYITLDLYTVHSIQGQKQVHGTITARNEVGAR